MDGGYIVVLINAKISSSSIPGGGSFRDYVLNNTLDDILSQRDRLLLFIHLRTRSDRRGKYRLAYSFDGRPRVIDYLLNNGSYHLCEGDGILARFTTEGSSNGNL